MFYVAYDATKLGHQEMKETNEESADYITDSNSIHCTLHKAHHVNNLSSDKFQMHLLL